MDKQAATPLMNHEERRAMAARASALPAEATEPAPVMVCNCTDRSRLVSNDYERYRSHEEQEASAMYRRFCRLQVVRPERVVCKY